MNEGTCMMKGALIDMQYVLLFPAMRRLDLNGCRRDRHKETGTSLCFHEGEKRATPPKGTASARVLTTTQREDPGATLVHFWCTPGALLVHSWCTPGALLVHSWCTPGAFRAWLRRAFLVHSRCQSLLRKTKRCPSWHPHVAMS